MSRSSGCYPFVFVCFVLALSGVAYWAGSRRALHTPVQPRTAGDGSRTDHVADVVVAMRNLARLETVAYHMERVQTLRAEQRRLWGLVKASDSILLIAAGDVTAGLDLSGLRSSDVVVDEERRVATVTLPAPRVLSARLDNERTHVYSRDTDLLARPVTTMESQARREAEAGIREAALAAGILAHARRNAAHTLRALISSFGYRRIEIRFRDSGYDGGTPIE